jgi:hypothetical protein
MKRRDRTGIGSRWRAGCATFVCALLMQAAPASANGRFPRAQLLSVGPGRSDELFLLRTTFGLLASDDGGQRFRFFCEEAYQIPDGYDPMVAWTSGGTLLVGTPTGLLTTRDLCDPARRAEFEGQDVVDLAGDATGRTTLASLQSRDAVPVMRVAWTDDGGGSWEVPREGIAGELPLTVEVAPSDARRGYLTSTAWEGGASTLRRSDDGGRTWRATGHRFAARPYLAGVDPTRPDTVYVRVELALSFDGGAVTGGGTALLRSDDGGDSFREVGRTRGAMLGFAVSDDGRRVWIGGPGDDDGLQRSDDGGAFERVSPVGVDCLRWHAGALYACETLGGRMGTALLSRSRDLGATRAVMARVEDVLPPPTRCPQGSIVRGFCAERWPAVRRYVLGLALGGPGPKDAGVAMDVARDAGGGGGGGGCGCRTDAGRPAGGAWWWALAALWWMWRRPRG